MVAIGFKFRCFIEKTNACLKTNTVSFQKGICLEHSITGETGNRINKVYPPS